MDFVNLITNVGFPIACTCVMAYYIKDNQKTNRERYDKLNDKFIDLTSNSIEAINNNTRALDDLTDFLQYSNSKEVHSNDN